MESLISAGAQVMLITADLHPEAESIRSYERVLLGRPVPSADWLQIAKTYRDARRFKPDVVVTELLRDPRWRVFGDLGRRITIIHDDKPHDDTHNDPWWIRSFRPWERRSDATIVFSEFVAKRLAEGGLTASPTYVAPLVTDFDPLLVPAFASANQRKDFLLVGRQCPYKNHAVIFDAWEAHVRGPAWKGDQLVLIGRGNIPAPLPIESHWVNADYRYRDIALQLARAKGSLIHQRNASQSGVQVMSMQLGVAPIVSGAGALPEYQPPGLPVVDVDDCKGLTRCFDELADSDVAVFQGRRAAEHYASCYQPAVAAKRFLEIFNEVVG